MRPLIQGTIARLGSMMFHFTLRDLMWVTAMTAFLIHAWIERRQTVGERVMKRQMNEALAHRDDIARELKDTKALLQAANKRAGRYARMASTVQGELNEARIHAWVSSASSNVPPFGAALSRDN